MKNTYRHLLVIVFFSLITIVMTYPQLRLVKSGIYSLPDQLFYSWMIERNIDSLLHKPLAEFFNASVFFPYKNTLAFGDHLIGETVLAFPFFIATGNPVFSQNILILLSFIISGYGMFLLFRTLIPNTMGAILAGLLFSFSNVRFNQYDHLNMLSTEFLPFIFLYLGKFLEKRNIKLLFIFSIFFLLTILMTVYYLVMVSVAIAAYIFVWMLLNNHTFASVWKTALMPFIAMAIVGVLVLPVFTPYLQFTKEFSGVKRVLADNILYSASLTSYFSTARTTSLSSLSGQHVLSEADTGLFFGYASLFLFFCAWFINPPKWKKIIVFFTILSGIFYLLSFGPLLKFAPGMVTSLPLPYYVLYKVVPLFQIMRVPARFALFGQLFLVLVSGVGYIKLVSLMGTQYKKYAVSALLVVIALLETWSAPMPLIAVEEKKDFPPVYQWLSIQPSDSTILELPIPSAYSEIQKEPVRHAFMEDLTVADRDAVEAYRDYFSLLHGKRIINGYSAYAPPLYLEMREKTVNFPDDVSLSAIKKSGVTYVIVHVKQYPFSFQQELISRITSGGILSVVAQFDTDYVVQVL